MRPPLEVENDEINALIHAYLMDSGLHRYSRSIIQRPKYFIGFIHTAYLFRSEAKLDRTPINRVLIKRGELIDLLTKALLYTEVQVHWKKVC